MYYHLITKNMQITYVIKWKGRDILQDIPFLFFLKMIYYIKM